MLWGNVEKKWKYSFTFNETNSSAETSFTTYLNNITKALLYIQNSSTTLFKFRKTWMVMAKLYKSNSNFSELFLRKQTGLHWCDVF